MAHKTERWLPNRLPVVGAIYSEYGGLPLRELSIVTAAVLDTALAELLRLRLIDNPHECEDFLGLDGDGRAPTASFGSRIQLALLVGLIGPQDAAILRGIKDLRNLFAHRSQIAFDSPEAQKVTAKLHALWIKWRGHVDPSGVSEASPVVSNRLARDLPSHEYATEGLLLWVFAAYHAKFQRLHPSVQRIRDALENGYQAK